MIQVELVESDHWCTPHEVRGALEQPMFCSQSLGKNRCLRGGTVEIRGVGLLEICTLRVFTCLTVLCFACNACNRMHVGGQMPSQNLHSTNGMHS